MMRKLLAVSLICIFALSAFAERVSMKEAQTVAKTYYYRAVNCNNQVDWNSINLECVVNPDKENVHYYVFDVNGTEGFVVVSLDNQITPVLAYSHDCAYNKDNMSPGQKSFMDYYDHCNAFALENPMEPSEEVIDQWKSFLGGGSRLYREDVESPTLLDGIVWEQGYPFNQGCPADSDGDHGHVYVGCVATATCHVMKYWNWPATGTSSYYHSNYANGGYGNINMNFANQTYNWAAIPDDPNSVNDEVSKICYHVGIGVHMYWGADGSGSQTDLVKDALKNYFKYSTDISYKKKSQYTDATWFSLIKDQIDNRYPIVYGGSPVAGNAGHAWNCDGYQIVGGTKKLHMCWGWGSYGGNGFYTTDNLTSTALPGGDEDNFCRGQEVIINIYPNQTMGACQTMVANGTEGSFDDGSRGANYTNNQHCTYTIKPTCGDNIIVKFSKFDLADGDIVNVYAGETPSGQLLGTYDVDNNPPAQLQTSKGAMTIEFITDGANTSDGWRLNYSTKYCATTSILTDANGSFGDGSGPCDYEPYTSCTWKIQAGGAIRINFDEFDLADGTDKVTIYKNSTSSSNKLAVYSGTSAPAEPIIVDAETVIVNFISNGSQQADGWKLTYNLVTGIEENHLMTNMSIAPNPGNKESVLSFSLMDNSPARLFVTNMLGQVLADQELNLGAGYHEMSLNEIVKSDISRNGVYFISLQVGTQITTQKFVVSE